jgi:lysophospholipase L1-like esterase
LLGSIVVTVMIGELATRWLRPQQLRRPANLYQPMDSVGYGHLPNLRARLNTGERTVDVLTDGEGYRVGAAGRVEGDTRVLVIGDSFMEAIEVPYEATVSGLLQERLPRALGRPVAVRDAGISGYDPPQYRIATARALHREHFDAIVVSIYTGNDVSDDQTTYFPARARGSEGKVRWPSPWSVTRFTRGVVMPLMLRAQRHSHLAVLLWNSTELLRIKFRMWEWAFPWVLLRREVNAKAWEATADVCAGLAAVAREAGVPVRFVVVPQYVQLDSTVTSTYARAVGVDPATVDADQPNTRLVAAMRARGLDVMDALAAMREAHRAGQRPYGNFDRHFSPTGHDIMAKMIEPWLVATLRPGQP